MLLCFVNSNHLAFFLVDFTSAIGYIHRLVVALDIVLRSSNGRKLLFDARFLFSLLSRLHLVFPDNPIIPLIVPIILFLPDLIQPIIFNLLVKLSQLLLLLLLHVFELLLESPLGFLVHVVALDVPLEQQIGDLVMSVAIFRVLVLRGLVLEKFVVLKTFILFSEESVLERVLPNSFAWSQSLVVHVERFVLERLEFLLKHFVFVLQARFWPWMLFKHLVENTRRRPGFESELVFRITPLLLACERIKVQKLLKSSLLVHILDLEGFGIRFSKGGLSSCWSSGTWLYF